MVTDRALAAASMLILREDVPQGSGLRISIDVERGVVLAIAVRPGVRDTVLGRSGARVFLDPVAARMLAGIVLDAEPAARAGVRFTVGFHRD